ncbi:adenylate kinase [Salix suchowensis]|nr:adenylate kinase [Salix suchowensis]
MATTSSCNFNWGVNGKGTPEQPCSSSKSSQLLISSNLSFSYSNIRYCLSLRSHQTLLSTRFNETKNSTFVVASAKANPLKIMISGAPASGKGTQCEFITEKYVLVHIAAGDLVCLLPDSQENGWLVDGYPRSLSQETALEEFGFQPDQFILLEVNEEILVERVVGRRLDPATGKIYHLNYSPPETEEIAARLTQRFDDTEDKVNGNIPKDDVFAQIDGALTKLLEDRKSIS